MDGREITIWRQETSAKLTLAGWFALAWDPRVEPGMSKDDFEQSRRAFLRNAAEAWTIAGLAPPMALTFLGGPAAAGAAFPPMPLKSVVKLKGSADGADVWWWISGRVYLCVPGGEPLQPLMRTETVGIERWSQASGGWRASRRDIGYCADLQTGQPLESWKNPLTGVVATPPAIANGPRETTLTAENADVAHQSFSRHGDEVILTEEQLSGALHLPIGPEGRNGADLSIASYYGSQKAIEDVARPSVPAEMTAQTIFARFPAWMNMDGQPGFLYARFYGTKAAPGAAIDPPKRTVLDQRFPGVLRGRET